jgi:hypothetical protein
MPVFMFMVAVVLVLVSVLGVVCVVAAFTVVVVVYVVGLALVVVVFMAMLTFVEWVLAAGLTLSWVWMGWFMAMVYNLQSQAILETVLYLVVKISSRQPQCANTEEAMDWDGSRQQQRVSENGGQ